MRLFKFLFITILYADLKTSTARNVDSDGSQPYYMPYSVMNMDMSPFLNFFSFSETSKPQNENLRSDIDDNTLPSSAYLPQIEAEESLSHVPSAFQELIAEQRPETTPEMIRRMGYPVEEHNVVTEDGYILTLHRIPHGRKPPEFNLDVDLNVHSNMPIKKPPVLLQHCFLCSSSDWVINLPNNSLGFILADAGYDVWLGNARGNTYSRNHTLLKPTQKKFWAFSWDEIANYDLPAMIDSILFTTNSSSISYVGFSMGTTAFYAMMSVHPQYNKKINVMIGLGPVAFLGNMGGFLGHLTKFSPQLKSITDLMGIYEVLPGGLFMDVMTSFFCNPYVTNVAPICDNVLLQLIGFDTKLMNKNFLTKFLAHTPAGTSVQNMIHFMQAKNTGKFQMYNYGLIGNIKMYNTPIPPNYDLGKTKVPVALFWAPNDWFANPTDVARLSRLLPNVIFRKEVPDKSFSHVDFLWSNIAVDFIYSDILNILRHYNS